MELPRRMLGRGFICLVLFWRLMRYLGIENGGLVWVGKVHAGMCYDMRWQRGNHNESMMMWCTVGFGVCDGIFEVWLLGSWVEHERQRAWALPVRVCVGTVDWQHWHARTAFDSSHSQQGTRTVRLGCVRRVESCFLFGGSGACSNQHDQLDAWGALCYEYGMR